MNFISESFFKRTKQTIIQRQKTQQTTIQKQQKIQDLNTIQSMGRVAAVRDVQCDRVLGAMVLSEQSTINNKSNQVVHGIRCHAIRVLVLSKRRSFVKSTPKLPRG